MCRAVLGARSALCVILVQICPGFRLMCTYKSPHLFAKRYQGGGGPLDISGMVLR